VRAAVRGIVDFTEARLLDTVWWQRCRILLEEMNREDRRRVLENAFNYHRSLVGNSGLTEESFRNEQNTADSIYEELLRMYQPWRKIENTPTKPPTNDIQELFEIYKQAFGDPNDPVARTNTENHLRQERERIAQERAKSSDVSQELFDRASEEHAKIAEERAKQFADRKKRARGS